MFDHLADVHRYDPTANPDTVARIVKHLGVALRNPSAATIACEEPKHVARLRQKWCAGKLGCADHERADQAIAMARLAMGGDAEKRRVTFYYLVAKQLGRLDAL